ncbi:hypothetical protein SAMN02745673_01734 [Marinactinospora thermotolerans DSM 45154]|uniref:Prohead serine protease n=1 Tax=Marinactinospora thermotolerans DSM 45154 TaxID=1122192 RepID=A0A1T4PC43_9ACTN|nr:hypothetical protein [Marinactinospora thermotolerans]SJZ89082.1 hypothetical protein SAMN02745673_01734 [Marinactinospora thermotolerans DSM 45154]
MEPDTNIRYLASEQVRDALGAHVTWVSSTAGVVAITDDGAPDGALVHPDLITRAGLEVVAVHGVRDARALWGTVRTSAATDGPQGMTYHGALTAVLVDHPTLTALMRGLPVLAFEELELTSTGFALADGVPVPPGDYAVHDGRVLRIHAPQQPEETAVNETTLFDPETPDEVIRETLTGIANRLVGAYMRAAQAATTPEAKEEAKAKMRQMWEVKNDLDMGRDAMVAEIQRLQDVLAEMREA